MRALIFAVCGIATLAVAAIASSSIAVADPLTRSSCWTAKFSNGATRTICFSGGERATMRNRSEVVNSTNWSTCEWTGTYFHSGKVIVSFAQGSGRCSNNAASPQYSVVCDFNGDSLECQGSSIVSGKTYEVSGTFE